MSTNQNTGINDDKAAESPPASSPKVAPTVGVVTGSGVSYTPAPWLTSMREPDSDTRRQNFDSVYCASGHICNVINPADARLIAAAPELLDVAEQYASECGECNGTGKLTGEVGFEEICPECAFIREVLAKVQP